MTYRFGALVLALALVAGCTGGGVATPAAPTASVDIKRAKLDLVYSSLADQHVHKPTSKALLEAALEAIRAEVKAAGGKDDVKTPAFKDATEFVIEDFKAFAAAAAELAGKNPNVSADRIADAAINAMIKVKPDCHTYYSRARSDQGGGVAAAVPADATTAWTQPDEAGLEWRMLPGNIGYITWKEFVKTSNYDITSKVKAGLDALVAQGAKGWLFDLRGNRGGDPPQAMTSWFLPDNVPTMRIDVRTGSAGTQTTKGDFRLPPSHQLPVVILLDRRAGSSPEVFTLGLKEHKRATIVGEKSAGCLGATNLLRLNDNSLLGVTVQEFVGAVTGSRYNNVGIPPDVEAESARALEVGQRVLADRIAGR